MKPFRIATAASAVLAAAVLAVSAAALPAAAIPAAFTATAAPTVGSTPTPTLEPTTGPTPDPTEPPSEPVVVALNLTYMVECAPDTTNTWRVSNPSTEAVEVSWAGVGTGTSGTHLATPGYTFFDTPRKGETMTMSWGGGDTGVVEGSKVKAAGDDKTCTQPPAPVEMALNLTYMTACAPDDDNTWRVRNPSSSTVTVSWNGVGTGTSGTHAATPGDTFFTTPRADETMKLSWGGGETGVVAGSKVKASGNDDACTQPPADPEPGLQGSTATGLCLNDAPFIDVDVQLADATPLAGRTVTLTLTDGTNSKVIDVGVTDATGALSNRVIWPGATVDDDGNATAWPGWKQLADGTWVETDENFAWTRDITSATITVNPELAVALEYPPATPNCNAAPPTSLANTSGGATGASGASGLARTGVDVTGVSILAVLLLAAGAGLVLVFRRRATGA